MEAKIMKLLDRHLDGEHLTWREYDKLLKMVMTYGHNEKTKLELEIKKLKTRVENLRAEISC